VNCAFEAVEGHRLAELDDLKRLIVVVAADIASHGFLLQAGPHRSCPTIPRQRGSEARPPPRRTRRPSPFPSDDCPLYLARRPDGRAIRSRNGQMPTLLIRPRASGAAQAAEAWGVPAVSADTSPFNGAGVVVAVLDTGTTDSTQPSPTRSRHPLRRHDLRRAAAAFGEMHPCRLRGAVEPVREMLDCHGSHFASDGTPSTRRRSRRSPKLDAAVSGCAQPH
jgi:hypothetical protein